MLDAPWIDASADRVLLTSMANFAGVLEALSARQRELGTACASGAVLRELELLRLFGAHECEQRFGALEAAFASYDDVIREVGPLLAGGKKLNSSAKKKGAHFDAAKLEEFDQKIAERTRLVVAQRDEFARACDLLAEHKLDVLAVAVDRVVDKAGAVARDSTSVFANLADAHARIKTSAEEQQVAVQCATSPLPRITATRAAALFTQLGAASGSAAAAAFGDTRLRFIATYGCDLRWVEPDKAFDPLKHVLNLRLCALRSAELPSVPSSADAALAAQCCVAPLSAPVAALEIVPHIGAPLRLLFSSAAERDDWLRHAGELVTAALSDAPLDMLSPREREVSRRAGRILRGVAGNRVCSDCSAPEPQWVSTTLGAVVCVRCAGVHRQLGGFVSRVRSIALDRWQPELLLTMQELGNSVVNSVFESVSQPLRASQQTTMTIRRSLMLKKKLDFSQLSNTLPSDDDAPKKLVSPAARFKPAPTSDINAIKAFIEDKYIHKKWVLPWRQMDATRDELSRELFDEVGRPSCSLQTCLQLVVHGADPNAHFLHGRTTLHQAVMLDSVTAVEFLLSHGARVAERDNVGWSAVHYAAHLNHYLSLHLLIRRCEEEDVFAPTAARETPFDIAQASDAAIAMKVLRNDLEGVALLTVDDVITRNHVVVQLTARSEAIRGTNTRRATLNRITSADPEAAAAAAAASSPELMSGSGRRKSKLRPSAPAPAPPAEHTSPVKSARGSRSGRRRRHKSDAEPLDAAAAAAGEAAGSAAVAATESESASLATTSTVDPLPPSDDVEVDGGGGGGGLGASSGSAVPATPLSDREYDDLDSRDVVNGMRNELLNEIDRMHVALDYIRESLPTMTNVADLAPIVYKLSRLQPEYAAMAQTAPSFEVPAEVEIDDENDVQELHEAVNQSVANATLLLSQLARSLLSSDIFALLSLAKTLRNCMVCVLGEN